MKHSIVSIIAYVAGSAFVLADTLPIISTGPQSLTVSAGSNVFLSVSATAATGYQWRFNGVDIADGTNASLTVTNAQVTNSGYYVVIAKNALGWAPSLPAYLSVVDVAGLVPFSNKFYSNAIAVYLYNDGVAGPVTNGTAQLIAGPALDQMQVVPGVSLLVRNGFFGSTTPSVPNVAAGQTLYYRVSVSYALQGQTHSNISMVLKLVAGGGTNAIPVATNFSFPSWLEWPDYDPYVDPPTSTPTNQLLIPGETLCITNNTMGYTDLGVPTGQWRKDGKKIGSPFSFPIYPFFTNVFLKLTNVQPSDAGVYDLEYLGNNWIIGPKTLLTVQVTNGQGVLQSPRPVGTNFCFDLLCAPRRKYLVQWSSNLVNWIDVHTVTNLNQNTTLTTTITNPPTPNGAAFYRSRLLP